MDGVQRRHNVKWINLMVSEFIVVVVFNCIAYLHNIIINPINVSEQIAAVGKMLLHKFFRNKMLKIWSAPIAIIQRLVRSLQNLAIKNGLKRIKTRI